MVYYLPASKVAAMCPQSLMKVGKLSIWYHTITCSFVTFNQASDYGLSTAGILNL